MRALSKKELSGVKIEVEKILKKHKLARGNDFFLIICYLRSQGIDIPPLDHSKFFELSGSISTVLRVRRLIQNVDKKFLPSKKILERRRARSELFKKIPHYKL